MKLVSLTICRNSSWSIRPVIHHALRYCDHAVVLSHASTDNTVEILQGFRDKVTILESQDTAWDEMDHRQRTLDIGRALGGTHFVILDDDEIMAHHLVPIFRQKAETLEPGELLRQPMRCVWRNINQYRSDPGNPFTKCQKSVVFRDAPSLHWKDAAGYQYHHTHPYNSAPSLWEEEPGTGWMHFQHADWRRLLTKQTWYMCMEMCRYGKVTADYKGTMDERGLKISPIPEKWKSEEMYELDLGSVPWQLADLHRMVDEKGLKFFRVAGIDVESILNSWE